MWWYLLGQDKELMKAQMLQLGGPLTWVAMHVLFALILVPKLALFFSFFLSFSPLKQSKMSTVCNDFVGSSQTWSSSF
jgi:hypothetical protein